MSETKFSPGPYIENGSGDDDIVICDALGEPVFTVIESFGPGEDAPEDAPDIVFHGDERIWANVALGLAAPDLYAALETLIEKLCIDDDEGLIEYAEPMIAARDALAKARVEATQ